MRKYFLLLALVVPCLLFAQDKPTGRSLTLEEYEKAKTFTIKDLDNDTYVKFDNTYILDRYESRKPYFITGDDGKKKRIDLYRFLLKDGLQELGTLIFYTDEKGKLYKACLPNFKTDSKIWEKYFEDIHAIDKVEPNYVLKLSYVLSKEFGFQLYKAANQGKDLSKEAGTYGSDICFPGDVMVAMADGSHKTMQEVKEGDHILTVDPVSRQNIPVTVTGLVTHEEKNYAITSLLLLSAKQNGDEITLTTKELKATPNHPVIMTTGAKKMGDVQEGESVICLDERTNQYETFIVWRKNEQAEGNQKVYNLLTNGGTTFLINDVIVSQKALKK